MPLRKAIFRPINDKEAAQLHKEMKAQSQALDAFVEDSQVKLKKLLAENAGKLTEPLPPKP
jgi:hypothetical protein